MIERRNLVGTGLLAGAAALVAGAPATAAQRDDATQGAVASALDRLTAAVQRVADTSPELERIREQQRTFLKANQKYPDFIEIGIDVWERVYDWQVRHQLPPTAARTADGRYVTTVLFTTLILRPDQAPGYVGFGFDVR